MGNNKQSKIFEVSRNGITCTLHQAELEDIHWINELDKNIYSENDAIPLELMLNWYSQSPDGFLVIKNQNEELIGHLDILPLRPQCLQDFVAGKITEQEIYPNCLHSPNELHLVNTYYIESIAVKAKSVTEHLTALLCLVGSFPVIANTIYSQSVVTGLYAIDATDNGEKIMKKLGFQVAQSNRQRKDNHNLLYVSFDDVVTNGNRFSKVRRT